MDQGDPFGSTGLGQQGSASGFGSPPSSFSPPPSAFSQPLQGTDPLSPQSFDNSAAFSQTSFAPQTPPQSFGTAASFGQPAYTPQPSGGQNVDLQVISAKLDAIRATLDSLNQRIASIERIAYGEHEQQQKGKYQW